MSLSLSLSPCPSLCPCPCVPSGISHIPPYVPVPIPTSHVPVPVSLSPSPRKRLPRVPCVPVPCPLAGRQVAHLGLKPGRMAPGYCPPVLTTGRHCLPHEPSEESASLAGLGDRQGRSAWAVCPECPPAHNDEGPGAAALRVRNRLDRVCPWLETTCGATGGTVGGHVSRTFNPENRP